MGLWSMMVVGLVGVPAVSFLWWASRRVARQERVRRVAIDGDQCDADEILIALGSTQEWV